MDIRALCTAAAVFIGVGSAADAATVTHSIVFTVTDAYDLTSYFDYEKEEHVDRRTELSGFWGFATGSSTRGTLEIVEESSGHLEISLTVAGNVIFEADTSGTSEDFYAVDGISGYIMEGLRWTGASGTFDYTKDGQPDYTFADATISLAPVPLPPAVALMPMGLGTLALLRKRRRRVS